MYCVHHRKALHRPTQGIEMPNAMHCIRHRKALRWIRGKIREKMNRILSERTGKPVEQIKLDTERDKYMFAEEALEYGLIDKIIEKQ